MSTVCIKRPPTKPWCTVLAAGYRRNSAPCRLRNARHTAWKSVSAMESTSASTRAYASSRLMGAEGTRSSRMLSYSSGCARRTFSMVIWGMPRNSCITPCTFTTLPSSAGEMGPG